MAGSKVLEKMDAASKEFMHMFGKKGSKLKKEEIDEAIGRANGMIPSVVTIKKRAAEDDLESLEEEVAKKKNKKNKKK